MENSTPHLPQHGEIWFAWLDPVVGHEQGGRRPVVVVSNDHFNSSPHGLRMVAPITSRNRGILMHVPLSASEGGFDRNSVVMCDQIRTCSLDRFRKFVGKLETEIMVRIADRLHMVLKIPTDEMN